MPADVMYCLDQIEESLETIVGLQVFNHPRQSITPPTVVISLPIIRFNTTKRSALDKFEFELTLFVGNRNQESAVRLVTPYIELIRETIEEWDAFQAALVTDAVVEVQQLGDNEYLCVIFSIWIEAGDELQAP